MLPAQHGVARVPISGTATWHHKQTTNDHHPSHHQSALTDEYTAEAVTHTASSTWGGYGANLNEKLIETQ